MRIIYKEPDVYDLQRTMFDKDRVWIRSSETYDKVVPANTFLAGIGGFKFYNNTYTLSVKVLFVAGNINLLFVLHNDKKTNVELVTTSVSKLEEYCETNNISFRQWWMTKYKNEFEAIATTFEESKQALLNILVSEYQPIVVIDKVVTKYKAKESTLTLVTNVNFHNSGIPWQEIEPNLYRLHQDLESYIFGVIGQGSPDMVTTSDKDRIVSHGFDVKKSFRKEKNE